MTGYNESSENQNCDRNSVRKGQKILLDIKTELSTVYFTFRQKIFLKFDHALRLQEIQIKGNGLGNLVEEISKPIIIVIAPVLQVRFIQRTEEKAEQKKTEKLKFLPKQYHVCG